MAIISFPFPSKVIKPKDLTIPRAIEVAHALQTGYLSYVKLIECRSLDKIGFECVIFNVEVELGQKNNVNPIEKLERIAVIFEPTDEKYPEVLSLRDDFPEVPHTNLREQDYPVSLCLYSQPYSETKLYLTPTRFIERIRQWLAETAKGSLHGDDQPLEPLFLESDNQLIIPFDLFDKFNPDNTEPFEVYGTKVNNRYTFIAQRKDASDKDRKLECVAVALQSSPQTHGVIHKKPRTLLQLHEFASKAGLDLLNILRSIFRKWQSEGRLTQVQEMRLMLVIAFPKTRNQGGHIEAVDIWGFLLIDTVKKIGIEIGVWDERNGSLGMLLLVDKSKRGGNLSVEMCKTMFSFSRESAAEQNGLSAPDKKKIVIVGVGALGSQIFMNLVREGYGEWTLLDNDIILPHNLARHALNGHAVGFAKADCLALTANKIIDGKPVARSIVKDILRISEYGDEIKAALKEADVILDCAASVSATHFIARDIPSSSRRISLFLNPSGKDSVLLAEDAKREIKLDYLEMQYCRLIINEEGLEGHLNIEGKRLRYANSCSDINSSLSQEFMSIHAAICSRAFRNAVTDDSARIMVWRLNPADMSVKSHSFGPNKMIEIKTSDWIIYTDEWLIDKIYKARAAKLPNETGGVLVGSFDMQRRIVYIMDTLLSPPDSKEWPAVYIRGCQGLAQKMKEIGDKTLGRLEYVGEWHSHPEKSSCLPSGDDKQAFIWLADMRRPDGLPAIMLIAGDKKKYAFYLGTMS